MTDLGNIRDPSIPNGTPWLPDEQVKQSYNQRAMNNLLSLQTVEWVFYNGLPAITPVDGAETSLGNVPLGMQEDFNRLTALQTQPLKAALSPELVLIDLAKPAEEILVRNVIRTSIYGALYKIYHGKHFGSTGPQTFEAGGGDILKLLRAVQRPTFRYSSLGFRGMDFIDSIVEAAGRNGVIRDIDDEHEIFDTFVRATVPVTLNPKKTAAVIAANNAMPVPDDIDYKKHERPKYKLDRQTAAAERLAAAIVAMPLWLPETHIIQPHNLEMFAAITPLETVKWLSRDGYPVVASTGHEGIIRICEDQIKDRIQHLSESSGVRRIAVFASDKLPIGLQDVAEEATTQAIVLDSIGAALMLLKRRERDPAAFLAGSRDMLKLLGAVYWPAYSYESLGIPRHDFVGDVLQAATRHGIHATDDQAFGQLFDTYVEATLPVVLQPSRAVKTIFHRLGMEVPEDLVTKRPWQIARNKAGTRFAHQRNTAARQARATAKETAKPPKLRKAGPHLRALYRDYEGMELAKSNKGISDLAIDKLRYRDVLSEIGAARMVSRMAILAYLEELNYDALAQDQANNFAGKLVDVIAQTSDEHDSQQFSSQREDAVSINRMLAQANILTKLGRNWLATRAGHLPAPDQTKFTKLFASFEKPKPALPLRDLPRAFAVVRFGLTRMVRPGILETPSTAILGDHVGEILKQVYLAEPTLANNEED